MLKLYILYEEEVTNNGWDRTYKANYVLDGMSVMEVCDFPEECDAMFLNKLLGTSYSDTNNQQSTYALNYIFDVTVEWIFHDT